MSGVETMPTWWVWAHIAAIALATFALRVSFIGVSGYLTISDELKDHMKLIPPAVLAALAVPPLVYREESFHLSLGDPYLIAGVVATLVAWRTENLLATIVAGFLTYFVIAVVVGF